MLKNVIISIFSIHGLSSGSNRILLQGQGPPISQPNPPRHCTEELFQCPDGSFVGKELPLCEFASCPPEIPPNNPAPPVNPAPPAGFEYGAYGQLCQITPTASSNICQSTQDIVTDADTGTVRCAEESDCCMCSSIQCGLGTSPCNSLSVGPSAAFGVRDVQVIGADTGIGAIVECFGSESCLAASIYAENVAEIVCSGQSSCEGAYISVIDPKTDFVLDCSGIGACNALKIEISFTAPTAECAHILDPTVTKNTFYMGGVECSNDQSCQGLEITVNNNGCDTVIVDEIVCLHSTGCDAATFTFIGDVDIANCQCGPSCDNAFGLDKCYQNLEKLECADPASCMGRATTFYNPVNHFEFVCGSSHSCADANIQIVLNQDPKPKPVVNWKGFTFGGESGAADATFSIMNEQGLDAGGSPITLNVEMIECGGIQSCRGTTFIKGLNVFIGRIICKPGACLGCMIKETVIDPGRPCDPSQGQILQTPQIPGVNIPGPIDPVLPQIPQPQIPIVPANPANPPNIPQIPQIPQPPQPQVPVINTPQTPIPPTNPSNPVFPWEAPQIPPIVNVAPNPSNPAPPMQQPQVPQPQVPANPTNPSNPSTPVFPWEAPQIPSPPIPQPQVPQPQVPVINTPQTPVAPGPPINPSNPVFPWEVPQIPPIVNAPGNPSNPSQPQVPPGMVPVNPTNPSNINPSNPVFPWEAPQIPSPPIPQPQAPQPQVPVVNTPQTPVAPGTPINPSNPVFPWEVPQIPPIVNAPINPSTPVFPWEAPQIPSLPIPQPQAPQPQVPVVNTPQTPVAPGLPTNPSNPVFPWEVPQIPPIVNAPANPSNPSQPQVPPGQVPVNPTNPSNINPSNPVFPWETPQIPQPQVPQPQVPVVNTPQTPIAPANPVNPSHPIFPWEQPQAPMVR